MLAPSIAPRAGVTCTASARGPRTSRHSAWRLSGGSGDPRARGKQRRDEKARVGRSRRASSSAEAPDNEWGATHEEWRVYVRSLTGLTRRAALMATVGGLSLGPARADEAESSYQSVVDASSTSDDDAASFGGGSPSVGATSADAPPTAAEVEADAVPAYAYTPSPMDTSLLGPQIFSLFILALCVGYVQLVKVVERVLLLCHRLVHDELPLLLLLVLCEFLEDQLL